MPDPRTPRIALLRQARMFSAQLQCDLRELGVRGTFEERLLAPLEDRAFDLRNHISTRGLVDLDAVAVCGPNRHAGYRYCPTRSRALRLFLAKCAFPAGSVFVDLGCGKGRALLVASRFGFSRIVGVEFARELCAVAVSNVREYRRRHPGVVPIDVVEADAVEYDIRPDENVFYLFNPFGPDLVQRVVRNISASVERYRRPAWIIYNEPTCRAAVESSGAFARVQTFRYGWSEFVVYASRPATG